MSPKHLLLALSILTLTACHTQEPKPLVLVTRHDYATKPPQQGWCGDHPDVTFYGPNSHALNRQVRGHDMVTAHCEHKLKAFKASYPNATQEQWYAHHQGLCQSIPVEGCDDEED